MTAHCECENVLRMRALRIRLLFGSTIALAVWTCVDAAAEDEAESGRARQTLVQLGYKNISIEGVAWWGCGKDDSRLTSKRFSAEPPIPDDKLDGPHHRVRGIVCCGLVLKGCTVRL